MTLTEFLLVRIAEDEGVAHAARPHEYLTTRDDPALGTVDEGGYETCTITSGRVLAECAAKRAVVGLHYLERTDDPPGRDEGCAVCNETNYSDGGRYSSGWPCDTLRALAAIYADHPDYDKSWRP